MTAKAVLCAGLRGKFHNRTIVRVFAGLVGSDRRGLDRRFLPQGKDSSKPLIDNRGSDVLVAQI